MRPVIRYVLILAVGVFVGAGITLERAVFAQRASAEPQPLPLEELRVFSEVFGKIKSDYVEDVNDRKLLEDAIQGMLAGLDPHSAYLDPETYREVRIGTEGEFGGLGIEVTMENGFVKVVAPIDDTPAHRAGLRAADVIIQLDDTPVKGMTLDEAVRLMRGKPGTDIRLTVVREGETKPLQFTLTRAVIRITSVKTSLLDRSYGYVRITQFQAGTSESLDSGIADLKTRAGGTLNGMVLDLRNNPGGVLNAAVSVADAFLAEGVIVQTRGRVADAQLSFSATPNDLLDGAPIVVLVNEGSASASEIVAGALQDHRRAIVMGTKTFGKGSVQTILPMASGAALKLTTARYYTPKDRSIQATGIEPDVVVDNLRLSRGEDDGEPRVRESDLARHLEAEEPAGEPGDAAEPPTTDTGAPSLDEDFQLREALNLLKGINIVRGAGG